MRVSDHELRTAIQPIALANQHTGPFGKFLGPKAVFPQEASETLNKWAMQTPLPFRSLKPNTILCSWYLVSSDVLLSLLKEYPHEFGLAAVCSFSSSGYEREAALKNLIALGEDALPYIAVRTCDWVGPVRLRAENALRDQFTSCSEANLGRVLEALPIVDKCFGTTAARILHAAQARKGFLREWRYKVSAMAASYLLAHKVIGSEEDWLEVLKSGLLLRNQQVSTICVKLARQENPSAFDQMLPSLLVGNNKQTRLYAIELAVSLRRADLLHVALVDRNWRVRNDARFYLKKSGFGDFSIYYRAQFPSPGAISGFAEVVSASQVLEVLTFLSHKLSSVRAAVINAFIANQPKNLHEILLSTLGDHSPRVVKAAIKGLRIRGARLDIQLLEDLMQANSDRGCYHALENGLFLLRPWDCMELILKTCAQGRNSRSSGALLQRWLEVHRKHLGKPEPHQLGAIWVLFQIVSPSIGTELQKTLRAELNFAQQAH